MATAHGIVTVEHRPYPYSITARIDPRGSGRVFVKGRVASNFPDNFKKAVSAVRLLENYILETPGFDSSDIHLRLQTPHDYPLAGSSYGLTLGMAILAAANRDVIPQEIVYSAGLGAFGDTAPVNDIAVKRRGAAAHKFRKLFLCPNQMDLMNSLIAQCPCRTLADAYAITFWSER